MKNRVFVQQLSFGKNNPISLCTDDNYAYRVTGYDQIIDIINIGYIRPKDGKIKGGHKDEVFWTLGGPKTFYYDKRPVLQLKIELLNKFENIPLSIYDLDAIWFFNSKLNKYDNLIDLIFELRKKIIENNIIISTDELITYINDYFENKSKKR